MTEIEAEFGKNKKIEWSNIAISKEEKDRLKQMAKKESRSMTNYLSVIINEKFKVFSNKPY